MARFYESAQGKQAKDRKVYAREEGVHPGLPGSRLVPLERLAKAKADIAAFASGQFILQANKPDGLADSTTERTAYALVELKQNDLVGLTRFAGEASEGFWAAGHVLGNASDECCCDLLCLVARHVEIMDNLPEEYVPGQTMEQRIDELQQKHGCNCSGTVTCQNREWPEQITLTFSEFSDVTGHAEAGDVFASELNSDTVTLTTMKNNVDTCYYEGTAPGTLPKFRQDSFGMRDWEYLPYLDPLNPPIVYRVYASGQNAVSLYVPFHEPGQGLRQFTFDWQVPTPGDLIGEHNVTLMFGVFTVTTGKITIS